jgi:hypothetical protein
MTPRLRMIGRKQTILAVATITANENDGRDLRLIVEIIALLRSKKRFVLTSLNKMLLKEPAYGARLMSQHIRTCTYLFRNACSCFQIHRNHWSMDRVATSPPRLEP